MEEREYEIKKKWDFIMKDPMLSISSIKKKAFDGHLAKNGLRSLCWKIFLDYFPNLETSTWQFEINKERQHYEDLKNKFIFDPNKANKEEINWNVNNPLSLEEESPWKQYFDNTELQKTIKQDVERTFPDIEFFRNDNIQNILCNILFIYCKLNKDISYRQGMHEILAPILLVVDNDKLDSSNSKIKDELMLNILDSKYVEHDSFFLFCQVMKGAKTWYEFNETISTKADPNKEKLVVPIVAKCQRIQNEMLKVVDNDLYTALKRNEIEPQLYGLRWLRLLFSREFQMDEVLLLWDGIFAEGSSLELVDWIALVMLIHIRDKIIDQEYSVCLTYLMKYPKLEQENEIVLFVESARKLKENWVELLSKNNEQQYKENINNHQQNHPNKINKIQSIIKSADKRLSWSRYDSYKPNKNDTKPISPNVSSSGNNNSINEHKSSLHEKQLEEENQHLKSKINNLESLIKNASNQMTKCLELVNTISNDYINSQRDNNSIQNSNQLLLDYDKLVTSMRILENILNNNHRIHSSSSSSSLNLNKSINSPSLEKSKLPDDTHTRSQSLVDNNTDIHTEDTDQPTNIVSSPSIINSEITDSNKNSNSNSNNSPYKSSDSQSSNQIPNKSEISKDTVNEHDQKYDDKVEIKDSSLPSDLTSSTSIENKLDKKPSKTSVISASDATNIKSTLSSPKKEILDIKPNDFSSINVEKDNIWNDSPKVVEHNTFDLKLDQNQKNHFDDIQLDSGFGYNAFSPTATTTSTTNLSNNFNSLSMGNPWEDPWKKPGESSKVTPFSITTTNDSNSLSGMDDTYDYKSSNNNNKSKMISPSSIHFNPFESVSKITSKISNTFDNNNKNNNNNNTSNNTSNNNNNINSNINSNNTINSNNNNHNNNKIDNISPKMNSSLFKSPISSPKLATLTTSPTTKPTTIESPSLYNASFNTKESSSRKSSFSSTFNNSNSLFSPEISSPSLKNSMLEKRIEENKKILFNHDDKDFSNETYWEDHRRNSSFSRHSKTGTNHHHTQHNLFDDEGQSTDDIFEFIKHSKNKTKNSFNNSLINHGYTSYSKNYHQRSNSNSSSNASSLKSPKITPSKTNSNSNTNTNTNIKTKFNSNSNSNLYKMKSPTLSSPKIKKHSISATEYVEYDPLLSPHLKPKTPFSYNSTPSIAVETDTHNSFSNGSAEEIGFFKSPSIVSLTPTLAASATTTMVVASASPSTSANFNVNVNANSTTERGRGTSSINARSNQENYYSSTTSAATERMMKPMDPGVPIVIEHLTSTTVDSLDTNKHAKPVLLYPLCAGVVHSLY
jgi:hypothetical protein